MSKRISYQKVAGILRKAGFRSSRTHQGKITARRTTGYTVCQNWRNKEEVDVSHDLGRYGSDRDEMMGLYATVLAETGLEFEVTEEYDGFHLIIKGAA